jgi:hypothetical protein
VLWLASPLLLLVEELPPHILNLSRIERQMKAELNRLPNYTCLETIDRYSTPRGKKPKPLDRVRINVAIIGGKELCSWPGARVFEDRKLAEMLNSGFISDGDFAAMTANIFVSRTAAITCAGAEADGARNLLRYDFHIPRMMSGWQLRLGNLRGITGARGSFRVDAGTLELIRLNFVAEDLPPFSPEKSLEESAEYGKVRIGENDILLPVSVDLRAESFDGTTRLNHVTFTGCRQYGVATSISFTDDLVPVKAAPAAAKTRTFPGGVSIPMYLDAPIDSTHAAVGDEIRAVVSKDVKRAGEVLLPRGALVRGVIRSFEKHTGNAPWFEVGMEFTEAEFAGNRVVFTGKPGDVTPFAGYHRNAIGFATWAPERPSPEVSYFYVEGSSVTIRKGTSFTWLTQTAPPQ